MLRIPIICLVLFSVVMAAKKPLPSPANVTIVYGEQSLDITWDSMPGTVGYNIYTAEKPGLKLSAKRKVNPTTITSGPHFTYIWDLVDGKRERRIKGYRHYLSITALYEVKGKTVESTPSVETDDDYFKGFDSMLTRKRIEKILQKGQTVEKIPVDSVSNGREAFLSFMDGPGKTLYRVIKEKIDPRETGACAPISTILVKLLKENGLSAFRIEGNFINEYHTFVIINIDSVEYILDYTADQFIPNSAPVLCPRDYSFLSPNGRLAQTGKPVYHIAKVYSAEQSDLADNKSAELFKIILDTVRSKSATP